MNLSAQISSLGTRIEELTVFSDTQFYSMEDRMDQYQIGFISRFESLKDHMDQQKAAFEHLQQRIEPIESRWESQHEEMMAYLRSVFPFPPP